MFGARKLQASVLYDKDIQREREEEGAVKREVLSYFPCVGWLHTFSAWMLVVFHFTILGLSNIRASLYFASCAKRELLQRTKQSTHSEDASINKVLKKLRRDDSVAPLT